MQCDNLLCDLRDLNKPVVRIGDLGLSKLKKGSFVSGNMRGTLPWWAGEGLAGRGAGVAAGRAAPVPGAGGCGGSGLRAWAVALATHGRVCACVCRLRTHGQATCAGM